MAAIKNVKKYRVLQSDIHEKIFFHRNALHPKPRYSASI